LWAALEDDAEIRLRPRLLPAQPIAAEANHAVAAVAEPAALPRSEPALAAATATATTRAPSLWGSVPPAERSPAPVAATPASDKPADRPRLATRVIVALVFGGLLGLFGLPRLSAEFNLPGPAPAAQSLPTPQPLITTIPEGIVAATIAPTLAPTSRPAPTPTVAPTAVPIVAAAANASATVDDSRVLFAERFVSPLVGWPHNPQGTAWFADGTYQLKAKEPGQFVAVGAPIARPVGDVMMSARFRKTGGPAGGGYGFIVRNQGPTLDGDTQSGRYVVVGVGDRGDVGIWQRDDTRWIDIMPWTHSNAVHTGDQANELSVTTQGNRLKFVVNAVEVATRAHLRKPMAALASCWRRRRQVSLGGWSSGDRHAVRALTLGPPPIAL
jgi:hypothetical protein